MSKAICYGMIGCGMMGQEHLRNIALIEGAHVGVIHEPDADMRAQAAAIAPGARFVDSVEQVLAAEEVAALVVASPNHMHLPQLEQIARAHPRPVLVEKPLFTDVLDLDRVRGLALEAPVWVAMEYRYMPPVAALIAAAGQATGGVKMLTIREHRFPFLPKVGAWNRFNARTGGTLVEKCCHFFDLMRHILRDDPVRIMASGGQDVNHLNENHDGRTPDIWDNAYVIVDFKGGARAMLELCMFAEGARYQEEIAAIGPKGKIECLVPGPGRFWPAHLGDTPVPQLIESPRDPKGPRAIEIPVDPALLAAGDHNGSTYYQHARFADVVRGQGDVEVGLDDGVWAVLMGMAAQESARTGRAMAISDRGFTPA
ncbi:MAG: Gfo/Idh/MocA family oxidoreductase [Alphaproteobacteria bacterium]|jgi:predicted dehydrogenase|nr:Gfo/Idh/MocA family oxidoreductase [Alphaproteobacteria bacterium]